MYANVRSRIAVIILRYRFCLIISARKVFICGFRLTSFLPSMRMRQESPLYLCFSVWNSLLSHARARKSPHGLKSLLSCLL